METANDPIKALLETTGFTCDDLLEKLLLYKYQSKINGSTETKSLETKYGESKTATTGSSQNISAQSNNNQDARDDDNKLKNINSCTENDSSNSFPQQLPEVYNLESGEVSVLPQEERNSKNLLLDKRQHKNDVEPENIRLENHMIISEDVTNGNQEISASNRAESAVSVKSTLNVEENVAKDYENVKSIASLLSNKIDDKTTSKAKKCVEVIVQSKKNTKDNLDIVAVSEKAKDKQHISNEQNNLESKTNLSDSKVVCDEKNEKNEQVDLQSNQEGNKNTIQASSRFKRTKSISDKLLCKIGKIEAKHQNEPQPVSSVENKSVLVESEYMEKSQDELEQKSSIRTDDDNKTEENNCLKLGPSEESDSKNSLLETDPDNFMSESKSNRISNNVTILSEFIICEGNESNQNKPLVGIEKRKSMSDELVSRLEKRIDEDNISENSDNLSEGITEKLCNISTDSESKVDTETENEVEVCYVESTETSSSAQKPLLKLRTDLFSEDHNPNFFCSDDEDHNNECNDLKGADAQIPKKVDSIHPIMDEQNSNYQLVQNKVRIPRLPMKTAFRKKQHLLRKTTEGTKTEFVIVMKKKPTGKPQTSMPPPNINRDHEDYTLEAQDEVRKNLKLQLSSLRNRKIKDNSVADFKKLNLIRNSKLNYKKQLLNEKKEDIDSALNIRSEEVNNCSDTKLTTTTTTSNAVEISNSDLVCENDDREEESLFSLSQETNFLIVDVQGGVEFLENEGQDKSQDAIKLTKTNDITKIKGWKNKKFDMEARDDSVDLDKDSDEILQDNCNNVDSVQEISGFNSDNIDSNTTPASVIEENSNEQLSPFVSNTLEEFLTENSTLNISYKIPKLGAEEGLKKKEYKHVVLPKLEGPITSAESNKKEKPKGLKAKTLAEKRRLLEKEVPLKNITSKKGEVIHRKSYVYYNGLKLYVPSMYLDQCLATIKHIPSKLKYDTLEETNKPQKKISIFESYKANNELTVKYKPGPLSKKSELQNPESQLIWSTDVIKLPKVKLHIVPEVGKPVPPHLMHFLPKFGSEIRDDFLEFALSAVVTKKSEKAKTGFTFSVPYKNNQKYMLVRRRKENKQFSICDIKPEKNTVKSVIEDIVDYVERKEEVDLMVKDAEAYNEELVPLSVIKIKESNKKNNKTKLKSEIQRLSCKLVNVTVEDNAINDQDCQKPFCKLGCVCRSLTCTPRLPLHCSKVECLLECKCPVTNYNSVAPKTSLLTNDTLTRLENQVKRNLAKVEKEFTQTIIRANDDTILIPSSGIFKTKRVKKIPKRFSDYLDDFEIDFDYYPTSKENDKFEDYHNLRNCFVRLDKLDLKGIAPLCLEHSCYNCRCFRKFNSDRMSKEEIIEPVKKKFKMTDKSEFLGSKFKESNLTPVLESSEIFGSKTDKGVSKEGMSLSMKKRKSSDRKENSQKKIKRSKLTSLPENDEILEVNVDEIMVGDEMMNSLLKKRKSSDKKESSECKMKKSNSSENNAIIERKNCARCLGVPSKLVSRNKLQIYKDKWMCKVKSFNSFEMSPQILSSVEVNCGFVDVITPLPTLASRRLKSIVYNKTLHQRKQTIIVRDDSEFILPDNSPEKNQKLPETQSGPEEINPSKNLPYVSVFDGEIVIATDENRDFVKKLGMKSVAPFMRLLPWKDLLRNYYETKIKIWASRDKNAKLLINISDKEPPNGYAEISKASQKNGIMMWILNKQLPKSTPPELVHLILSPNNEHFEISGICLKNIQNSRNKTIKQREKRISSDNKVTDQERRTSNNVDRQGSDNRDSDCNWEMNVDKKRCGNKDNVVDPTNKSTELWEEGEIRNYKEIREENRSNHSSQESDRSSPNILKHKNHKNELNVLCLTEALYRPTSLTLAPGEPNCDEEFPLLVELPAISSELRWRMLFLNSNFSFLSFINDKYSIKYNDLKLILRKSHSLKKTILLQSEQLSSGYSEQLYGIYAAPKFRDRLFIGPYRQNEDHGLETLRYLNKSLVSTAYFENVHGGKAQNVKKSVWLVTQKVQPPSKPTSPGISEPLDECNVINLSSSSSNGCDVDESQFAEITPVIDSSPDDEVRTIDETSEISKPDIDDMHDHANLLARCESLMSSDDSETKSVIAFPQFTLINFVKLKQKDINLYFVTNIPHFGYLAARLDEALQSVEISWPFANKTLRFENCQTAKEFLKRRFANLLLPVPSNFQINVSTVKTIDPQKNFPVSAKVLGGTHICGKFGILDSRKLTPQLAASLGTTQEEVLQRLAKRAQYLGAIEIQKLKDQEKILFEKKRTLIHRKQKNLMRFMNLLANLPEKDRLSWYNKFRHEFTGDSMSSTETNSPAEPIDCIEIKDSDSEMEVEQSDEEPNQEPLLKNRVAMKSILKPLKFENKSKKEAAPSTFEPPESTEGLTFVKKIGSKLIVVKDTEKTPASLPGVKMVIRNQKVILK